MGRRIIYEVLQNHPEFGEYINYLNPKSSGSSSIQIEYEKMIGVVEKISVDISKYVNIVTLGPQYVASDFAWETAGYFVEINGCNAIVDSLNANDSDGVDEISKIVNFYDKQSFDKRRTAYEKISKYIY